MEDGYLFNALISPYWYLSVIKTFGTIEPVL